MTARTDLDVIRAQLESARAEFRRLRNSGADIRTLNAQMATIQSLQDDELRTYLAAVDEVRPPVPHRLTYTPSSENP